MDLLAELESMAVNVVDDIDDEPEIETIKRWQTLFQYSYTEAIDHIKKNYCNLSRPKVSDEHWALVRSKKEIEGYDRDAYEYSLTLEQTKKHAAGPENAATATAKPTEAQKRAKYLLKLEGFLNSAEKIREVGSLMSTPSVISGTSDSETDGSEDTGFFCHINYVEKQAIVNGLSDLNVDFRPTFIKISKAEKALSSTSIYPTLGIDSTLPQHRLAGINTPRPTQDEYPVWYFFYGTLADSTFLLKLLSLSEKPELRPASVEMGTIGTWAGKYRALIDAASHNRVDGFAYLVNSCEHEEILQYYETEKYEVVRCLIRMSDNLSEVINGLTFRFVGDSQDLD
ncbi:hypothetical protein FQN54_002883 [Arachnomyces sp. PD_36]|nr:hypothetical protein FQN54_002883 [Arachnomyces sp. PD_36]